MKYTHEEKLANDAIRDVLRSLRLADDACLAAGYGSEISASIEAAMKAMEYALSLAEDR